MSRLRLCATADVPAGTVRKIETAGLTLAVYHVNRAFYVTDDACTHGPGSLSEGALDGDEIECNFHQGRFNVRTGEVAAPPCMIAVRAYHTVAEDGAVWIDVES